MNAPHWHLALNHLPVVGMLFGSLLLWFAMWRKNDTLIRVCLGVLAVVALTAVPVYLTGEPAEMEIMEAPDFVESLVDAHKQAASIAFTTALVVGTMSGAGLFVFRKATALPPWFKAAVLCVALIDSGLLGWTANLGGRIRHPEVRPAGTATEAKP